MTTSCWERLIGRFILVLIVNVVVTHVEIEHLVVLVRPDHGIVPAVSDLVLFWPVPSGKLVESMDSRMFMSGSCRRSFSQLIRQISDMSIGRRNIKREDSSVVRWSTFPPFVVFK